jgi:copper chaperone CopZ
MKGGSNKMRPKIVSLALLTLLFCVATAASNQGDQHNQQGGQIVVKTSRDHVEIQSDRFRCPSCLKRVVDALKSARGVNDVRMEGSEPPNVVVQFDSRKINARRIGLVAKRALEAEPHNRAPVKVKYEKGG